MSNLKNAPDSLVHFTIDEVGKLLQISRRTVYTYIESGQIRGVRIASKWRFTKEDIEGFLEIRRKKEYPRYVKGVKRRVKEEMDEE